MALRTQEGIPREPDHIVHFYERESDLVDAVAPYLSTGIRAGEAVVVIARESHRRAFRDELEDAGIDVARISAEGRLIELDAAATVAAFTVEEKLNHDAFQEVIGGLVREVARSGRAVRAYGEMVALLWERGEVLAAIELEAWWNELARERPFSLFCSYAVSSVSGHERADALHQVCQLHSAVVHPWVKDRQNTSKDSTEFELAAEFGAGREDPGRARRMVVAALRRRGYRDTLVQDAALVLTELAANAVLHAGSPFSVSVNSEDSVLRIAVGDRSSPAGISTGHGLMIPRLGRGLGLIDALSSRWGTAVVADGKIVWAELELDQP